MPERVEARPPTFPNGDSTEGDVEDAVQRRANIKVVVAGDEPDEKSCLFQVFAYGRFSEGYQPAVIDNLVRNLAVDGKDVELNLWDTSGLERYDSLRTFAYTETNCFLVCFSVVDEATLSNVRTVWLPELRRNRPEARILLVGTKADLRTTATDNQAQPGPNEVSRGRIRDFVLEHKLDGYLEISVRRSEAVNRVLHAAIRLVLGTSILRQG